LLLVEGVGVVVPKMAEGEIEVAEGTIDVWSVLGAS
jgi:hypothetical protein